MISDKLTDEQKQEIYNKALELVYEDVQQNEDYLYSIVKDWLKSRGTEEQLETISSDIDMHIEFLSFDPMTGEAWLDEE